MYKMYKMDNFLEFEIHLLCVRNSRKILYFSFIYFKTEFCIFSEAFWKLININLQININIHWNLNHIHNK